MIKPSELREMSGEQLALTLHDTTGNLFTCGSRRRRSGSTRPASSANIAAPSPGLRRFRTTEARREKASDQAGVEKQEPVHA